MITRQARLLSFLAALTVIPVACSGQHAKQVAVDIPALSSQKSLHVSSKAIAPGRPIPTRYSSYDRNVAPDVEWTPALPNVKSYSLLIEDPDAPGSHPFVHWVMVNIPPDAHSVPEGRASGGFEPREAKANRPNSVLEGTNGANKIGYYGPHPPKGDPPHHYHFEVFALDRMLAVAPGANRDAVVAAMRGHVVAKGEMVATYRER